MARVPEQQAVRAARSSAPSCPTGPTRVVRLGVTVHQGWQRRALACTWSAPRAETSSSSRAPGATRAAVERAPSCPTGPTRRDGPTCLAASPSCERVVRCERERSGMARVPEQPPPCGRRGAVERASERASSAVPMPECSVTMQDDGAASTQQRVQCRNSTGDVDGVHARQPHLLSQRHGRASPAQQRARPGRGSPEHGRKSPRLAIAQCAERAGRAYDKHAPKMQP
jgi:hypothetical protein